MIRLHNHEYHRPQEHITPRYMVLPVDSYHITVTSQRPTKLLAGRLLQDKTVRVYLSALHKKRQRHQRTILKTSNILSRIEQHHYLSKAGANIICTYVSTKAKGLNTKNSTKFRVKINDYATKKVLE